MGAGIEPGIAARHLLDMELAPVEIGLVHARDLELAPRRWRHRRRDVEDLVVVEIQARHRPRALGLLRLLDDAQGAARLVEGDDAVGLRVLDMVGEDRRTGGASAGRGQQLAHPRPEEQVVAEHQRDVVGTDEVAPDHEGLRQALGPRLDRVGEAQAELLAGAEQALVVVEVLRARDDQDLADAGQHQHRDRVVDHRLVVDRQQLLVDRQGRGMQPRARPARQNDALHAVSPWMIGPTSRSRMSSSAACQGRGTIP